jgi:DHA1 family tetracycline resistance protein-like MFS transporter
MNKPLTVIFITICLDAVGMGLIIPILPRLLEHVTHASNIAAVVGIMTSLYALMQFFFAPVLGALSDRLGRRPVLLVSLAGAATDYWVMAFAPQLWMLLIGRAIAGLTSANMSVATAYLTDITPEAGRAGRFGLFNAMFGIGFIIGPVLGGVLGDIGLRWPFVAAGLLNSANLLLALSSLPESHRPQRGRIDFSTLNPLRPLRWVLARKHLLPVTALFFMLSAAGEAYGICWTLWGHDAFHWDGLHIGLSLGTFGICQALAQGFLPAPAVKLLGERGTVLAGIVGGCITLVVMAFARVGWQVFAVMPLLALTGIGSPALQSLATRQVDPQHQGQLQGVLASAVSLASIIAPLAFSSCYFMVRAQWPGAVWLTAVGVQLLAIPLVLRLRFHAPTLASA